MWKKIAVPPSQTKHRQQRQHVSAGNEDRVVSALRLQPAELNALQLLYPASRDGYVALQQLLAEIEGDIAASCANSPTSTSYLRPVSTADGASLSCVDNEDKQEAVSSSLSAKRQRQMVAVCRPLMLRICGIYLLDVRRHDTTGSTGALDPVANFHLGNGAEIAGLSWAVR